MVVYVKWKEKRGTKWSAAFWKSARSTAAAKKFEKDWNMFDNPYDKIKILSIKTTKPKGIRIRR